MEGITRSVRRVGLLAGLAGLAAIGTACGPEYPNCDSDEDCRTGEFCVNNLCVRCRGSQDCAVGQECRDGACRDIPGYCDAQRRCPLGQVCRSNRCAPCASDSDCGPGMVCESGACVAVRQCDADHLCPAGEECVNGRCRPIGAAAAEGCQYASIYFDFDRDNVRRDQRDVAQANRQCMTDRGRPIRLTGYCDERGTAEYNMALGERRGRSVRRYLLNLGARERDVSGTNSRGSTEARHCYEETCWQQDRRVDFRE